MQEAIQKIYFCYDFIFLLALDEPGFLWLN